MSVKHSARIGSVRLHSSSQEKARVRLALAAGAVAAGLFTGQTASAATLTWDGGTGGTGTDLGVAANWTTDTLPNGATPDIMQWNGTVAGNLSLTYATTAAFLGNAPGLYLSVTSGQTGSLQIDSTVTSNNLRLNASGTLGPAISIAAGAGMFTLGNGSTSPAAFTLSFGSSGSNDGNPRLLNNSSNTATINSDVALSSGGAFVRTLIFDGTGNWEAKGNLLFTNSGAASSAIAKVGVGTLTLSGANTYAGATTLSNGTTNVTGSINSANTANYGRITVGDTANTAAVMNIATGGIVRGTTTAVPGVLIGATGAGATGVVNVNGGTLTTTAGGGELWLGSSTGTAGNNPYGALILNSGTVTTGSWLAIGRGSAAGGSGRGYLAVNGGTLTVNTNPLDIGAFQALTTGIAGVGVFTAGTTNVGTGAAAGGSFYIGENLSGVANLSGTAAVNVLNTAQSTTLGVNAGGTGVLNLGGTSILTTPKVAKGAGPGTFNFHGGTLKANVANATYMTGLTNAYVYSEGGAVNNNGFNITIGQALLAPTGSGVSAAPGITASSGYVAPPIVEVTGGGGTGATAVAAIDSNGQITGITITNPGVGYTSTPTFTLYGGGGTATLNTGTIAIAANTAGGLTFSGAGTTTLTGNSTYTGATGLTAGKLIVSGSSASSAINASGGSSLVVTGPAAGTAINVSGNSAFDGTGSVGAITLANGASNTIANGNLTTVNTLSAPSLTFNGAATANLRIGNTGAAAIALTGALTTTPANGTVALNVAAPNGFANGLNYLISFGSFGGSLSDFTLASLTGTFSPRQSSGGLVLTGSGLAYNVIGDSPKWTGADSNVWKVGGTGPGNTASVNYNWKLITAGTVTDYIEGDQVLFDDTATGSTNIDVAVANVQPTATTFANNTLAYTLGSSGGFGIAGNGSLTKTGGGALVITNANTYTGATIIGSGATLTLGDGVTAANDGSIASTSGVANSGTLAFNRAGNTGTASYAISGNGSVVKTGPGTQTLAGASTYTGGTTISNGILSVAADNNLGASSSPVLLNGGTLRTTTPSGNLTDTHVVTIGAGGGTINVSTAFQLLFATNNTLIGSGPLTAVGIGTNNGVINGSNIGNLRITGTNSYNGTLTLTSGGILEYGTTGALDSTANIVVGNEGELAVNNTVTAMASPVTVNSPTGIISFINGATGTITGPVTLNTNVLLGLRNWYGYGTGGIGGVISGNIGGTGGLVTTNGSATVAGTALTGLVTLSGNNTFDGPVNVNVGTVIAASATALGSTVGATNVATNGALDVRAAITGETVTIIGTGPASGGALLTGSGTGSVATTVNLAGNSSIGGAGALTLSAGLTDVGGTSSVTKVGAGVTTLLGNSTYGGATAINAGTLRLGDGTTDGTIPAGNIVNAGAINFARSTGSTFTYANVISGAGQVIKSGSGTQILTGTNTYTGSTFVKAGTLIVDGGIINSTTFSSIGQDGTDTGTLTVRGTGKFTTTSDLNAGDIGSSSGTINIQDTAVVTAAGIFVGSANAAGSTANGTINQTGGSVVQTSTTLNTFSIGGRNTATTGGVGVYNLSGGTVSIAGGLNVGDIGTGTVNQSGGTLTQSQGVAGAFLIGGRVAGTAVGIYNLSGGSVISSAGVRVGDFATGTVNQTGGVFAAKGGINISRNGGNGVYNLDGGTLASINVTSSTTPTASNSIFNFNGGTLSTGVSQTQGGGTSAAANAGGFLFNLARANVRNGGAIFDTGNQGANVPIIVQALLHSNIGGDNALDGGLTKNGTGSLVMTGVNTYTGPTTINVGTLQLEAAGSIDATSGVINSGVLAYNRTTVANTAPYVISGTGSLTKSGAFTQTLTGVNTYTGSTTINSGTLQIGDGTTDGSIAASSNVVNNGTLAYNRTGAGPFGYAGPISGTGNLTKSGAGKQVLSGSNTYSGGTAVTAGTLVAGHATSSFGTGTTVASGTLPAVGVIAGGTATAGAATAATGGPVTVNSGGLLTAGSGATITDTVGKLASGNNTWNTGGMLGVKVTDSTAAAGVGYDTQTMGTLSLLGGTNGFTIVVLDITGATNAFKAGSYLLATTAGILNGATPVNTTNNNTDLTSLFALNINGVPDLLGDYTVTAGTGMFGGGGDVGSLYLNYNYSPAPEPGTMVLAGLAVAPLLGRRRRRTTAAA